MSAKPLIFLQEARASAEALTLVGGPQNIAAARAALMHRQPCNSAAQDGQRTPDMERLDKRRESWI